MGRTRNRIVICSIALVFAGLIAQPASAIPEVEVHRLGGTDNIGVSVEVARFHDYPASDAFTKEAMLARADAYPDALAAAGMTATRETPLFLTSQGSLDPRVAAELDRAEIEHVWILGGEHAISAGVEAEVQSRGMTTTRLAGATRIETALAIANHVGTDSNNTIVLRAHADGPGLDPTRGFADSLAAGMGTTTLWNEPLLLSESARLTDATAEHISENQYVDGTLIGGPSALSEQVRADLDARVGSVRRVAGADRYATAVAVSMELHPDYDFGRVVLVDGTRADSWAPGFTAAILGVRVRTALILSNGNTLPEVSRQFLTEHGTEALDLICTAYVTQQACDAAAEIMQAEDSPG